MSERARQRESERGGGTKAVRTYEDLVVWQKAMQLAEDVYRLTHALPDHERFGLVSQMRRSAVSVPSNIAEGHARESRADYIRHLRNARGSLAELRTQLALVERLNLSDAPGDGTRDLAREVGVILQAVIKGLQRKAEEQRR